MNRRLRRLAALLAVAFLAVAVLAGCETDGRAIAVGEEGTAGAAGEDSTVNTDQYDDVLLECQILPPATIARVVGGGGIQGTFSGAICRWVLTSGTPSTVTFTWYEWGTMAVEKDTAKRFGYTTENIKVASQTAFTQRDPKRPGMCGVTAKAPSRGVFTWWVEQKDGAAQSDPCAAPTKLMELVLTGGQ